MMNDKQIAMVKMANKNFADAINTYLQHMDAIPPVKSWTSLFRIFTTVAERQELIKTHLRTIQQAELIVSLCDQIIALSTPSKK